MSQMQPAQSGSSPLSRYRTPGFGGQNQMQGIMQMLQQMQQMRGTGQGKMGGRAQQAQPTTNPAFGQQTMPAQQMPQPSMFQPVQQPAPRTFPAPAAPVAPEITPEAQRQEEMLRQTDPYYGRIRDAGLTNTAAYQQAFGMG